MGAPLVPRQLRLLEGEAKLRSHLPEDVALTTRLWYAHDDGIWTVLVRVYPEGNAAIDLGAEPLEEFPSELMIAQAMLVS